MRALVVTIPRSGTHLLDSAMERMPGWERRQKIGLNAKLRYHPLNLVPGGTRVVAGIGRPHPVRLTTVRARLGKIGDHQYGMAQLPFSSEVSRQVDEMALRLIVAVRDPRDILVSQYMLAKADPSHVLHTAVSNCDEATGFEVLLAAHTDRRGRTKVGIGDQLDAFAGWLSHPTALVTRFEDLIGPQGGGSADRQAAAIRALADHLGAVVDGEAIEALGSEMYGAGKTFRKGQAGGWRDHLDTSFERSLADVAGPLLARYGYPTSPGQP